jgi:hypothetical protein
MIVGLDIMNICCLIQQSDKIVIIINLNNKKGGVRAESSFITWIAKK